MAHGDGGGTTFELDEIAPGELLKFGGLVAIPPAQFSAGSDVLQPLIETRLALFHPTGQSRSTRTLLPGGIAIS